MDVIRVVVVEYIYILIACAGGNRKATGLICKDFTGGWYLEYFCIAVMGLNVVWIRWWKERIINRRRVINLFINRLGRTSLGVLWPLIMAADWGRYFLIVSEVRPGK